MTMFMGKTVLFGGEIAEKLNDLRIALAEKNLAFGALFVGQIGCEGNMLLLAEGMNRSQAFALLSDLITAAELTRDQLHRVNLNPRKIS